jgi:hypothetical protein
MSDELSCPDNITYTDSYGIFGIGPQLIFPAYRLSLDEMVARPYNTHREHAKRDKNQEFCKVTNIKVDHEDIGKVCFFPLGRRGSFIEAKLVEVYYDGEAGEFVGVGEVKGNCIPVEAKVEQILVKG